MLRGAVLAPGEAYVRVCECARQVAFGVGCARGASWARGLSMRRNGTSDHCAWEGQCVVVGRDFR